MIGRWEVIGPDECPVMLRRTLLSSRWLKVLWHRFMPGATDRAAHDHPRSFVTIVLRGGYDDVRLCRCREQLGYVATGHRMIGGACLEEIVDMVRAPTLRYRHATHAHVTNVHDDGATTLCIMGPLRREWGFWHDGRWYDWRRSERLFGRSWRCP